MSLQARHLIEEVETELATASPDRRLDMLRRVTDLCVSTASTLSDDKLATFDHIITWMAHDMEFRARLELSERLSTLERAPRKILGDLAADEVYEVARPILENSKAIAEDVLVRIAEAGDESRLISIARRASVSERLSDVIVKNGGSVSVQAVADNSGARFSEYGFNRLVERAGEDVRLQSILAKRSDLPPEVVSRLTEQAKQRAAQSLGRSLGDAQQGAVDAAIDGIAAEIVRNQSAAALLAESDEAEREVTALWESGKLDEARILGWIEAGEIGHALYGLRRLTRLPFSTIKQAFHAPVTDPLLFMVKSVPLSLDTYHQLLAAKIGYRPSEAQLAEETRNYELLSVATAQRTVRFMAARSAALAA